MSPISSPSTCPNLIQDDTFYFCSVYHNKPQECTNHDFPSRFCPIGMDVLRLEYPEDTEIIRMRLEMGYLKASQLNEVNKKMDISEWLDEDCDAKATFEENGELGGSVLIFSLSDDTKIRVYPNGIKILTKLLRFIEDNKLILD